MENFENTPKKKKKKIDFANHVFRIILLVALSIFVGVSLFIFNSKTLLHNDYPTVGGYGVSVVISGSMEPTLNVNDLIIFHEQDEYEVDDIVIYAEKKSSVVHRLIEFKDDDKCITQGDANNTPDKEIFINQIKGKVICNIPFVGFFINDVSKYVFLFVIIGLLSLSFIAEAKNRKIDKMRTSLLLEEIMALRQNANMNTNDQVFLNVPVNYPEASPMQSAIPPVQNYASPQNQYEESPFEDMESNFNEALKLKSDYIPAINNRVIGNIHKDLNFFKPQNIESILDIIKKDNENLYAVRTLAKIYFIKGDFKSANNILEAINSSYNFRLYTQKGFIAYKAKELDKALNYINKAISFYSDNATDYIVRGRILTDLGRYGEAQADFQKALSKDKKSYVTYYYHAKMLNKCGNADNAYSLLKKYFEIKKGNTQSPNLRKILLSE